MLPDLHLDPDGLRIAADSAAAVLASLVALPSRPADSSTLAELPGSGGVRAEEDRLTTALHRACQEVGELAAVLSAAACSAAAAEEDARRAVARAGGELR